MAGGISMDEKVDVLLQNAEHYMDNKRYDEAISEYKKALDLGSIEALVELGEIYYVGFATKRDNKKAFEYLKQAAEAGNFKGMFWLGKMYACGYGVEIDAKSAIYWIEKAANGENTDAMVYIAETYSPIRGDINPETGVREAYIGNTSIQREADIEKAVEWYLRAIEVNDHKIMMEKLLKGRKHKQKNDNNIERARKALIELWKYQLRKY